MKKPAKNIVFIFSGLILISLIFIFSGDFILSSTSKSTDDCMACHEDESLTMEKDGKTISLFVDKNFYKYSVHGESECVDCHMNYNPDAIPHTASPGKVNCVTCHEDSKGLEKSVHSNTSCADCHSKHDIKSVKILQKDQTQNCLKCHDSKKIRQFNNSVHDNHNIGCEGCHKGVHSVNMISRNEVSGVCGKCHNQKKADFNNSIHNTVMKDGNANAPVCTDCHGSHRILTSKISIESESCLKCHLDEKLFPGKDKGSAKFVAEYKTSIHASIERGQVEAAGCVDCHGNHMISDPNDPQSSTSRYKLTETCAKCHKDIADQFLNSAHGKSLLSKNVAAPTCVSCHNEHTIKSVSTADDFTKINQVEMCLKCHEEGKLPHKNYKGEEELITNYKDSYHYKALKEGKDNAATCSNCHGAHQMNKFDDPDSKIYKKNIANTCGQVNCHIKEYKEYEGSVHNQSILEKPNSDAPTCTGCHGNHQILKKDESKNRLASSRGLVQLCSDCHNSVELTTKYQLPVGRTESYLDSYHGLAVRGGSKVAADCESCHGNHNIRASSDTLSSINKKNLAETCGKCHPGAETTFFLTKIHIVNELTDSPFVFWITLLYIILIAGTIGLMIWHNFKDLKKKIQSQE